MKNAALPEHAPTRMAPASTDDPAAYLAPSYFIDYDHPTVAAYADDKVAGADSAVDKAVRLYYAVRDDIRYDPYAIRMARERFKASYCLEAGRGFCVQKGVVMMAVCRHAGIPARLGLADVRNHLATPQLLELLETDLFIHHGFVELFLDGRWVKSTPVFNRTLCERFNVVPLEFDGRDDSVFHAFDAKGRRHMEYVHEHGVFADLPYDDLEHAFLTTYPRFFQVMEARDRDEHDFYREAEGQRPA